MKHIRLCTAVAAVLLAEGAFAQSQSSGSVTGSATSSASNQGANSSTNTSSAFQNAASNSVSTNSQNNGSASSLNATINIVQPAGGTSASAGTNSSNSSVLRQSLDSTSTSRSEQVLSGSQEVYTNYGGSYTIKNVPSMNAPPLASSNDTCMGSASGGVAIAGFGLTAGSTYTDEHCTRIKMSRELWNKGMKAASLAMDCMDQAAREALEITGYVCPQTTRAQRAAEEAAGKQAAVRAARTFARATYPPPLPAEALAPVLVPPEPPAGVLAASPPVIAEAQPADEREAAPQGNVVIRRVDPGAEAAAPVRGE